MEESSKTAGCVGLKQMVPPGPAIHRWRGALKALLLVLFLVPVPSEVTAEAPLVVVVNPDNNLSSIDRSMLIAIYLRRVVRWTGAGPVDGKKIIPLDLPSTDPHRAQFSRIVLRKTTAELKTFWLSERLKGGTRPPLSTSSIEDLIKVIEKVPGAIGYLPKPLAIKYKLKVLLQL